MECNCIIGSISTVERSELVTPESIREIIDEIVSEQNKLNDLYKTFGLDEIKVKGKDYYMDFLEGHLVGNSPIRKFTYCPDCGKHINWIDIRKNVLE